MCPAPCLPTRTAASRILTGRAADDGVLSGQIIISTGLMPRTDRIALAGLAADVAGPRDSAELAWIANAIRAVLAWADRRHVGLSSACGIFVVLAICAATWFSAGTRTDNLRGVAALWAGFLALKAGQRLAWPPRPGPSRAIAPPRRRAAPAGTSAGMSAGAGDVILRPGATRQAAASGRGARSGRRLLVVPGEQAPGRHGRVAGRARQQRG